MTFNPYLYTKGVFRPEEIALMRTTYRRIVRNEWFSASPDKRAEFARYIVRMYCRGMVIPEKLETLCLAAARARFSETFQGAGNMEGRRVLVVEDEYLLAREFAENLGKMGAEVIGPVGTLREALDIVGDNEIPVDAALLDVALHGETVFAVAAILKMRRIPFAFLSDHEHRLIPPSYRHAPRFRKPADWAEIAWHLLEGTARH